MGAIGVWALIDDALYSTFGMAQPEPIGVQKTPQRKVQTDAQ
jgi:hypothetical protein